MKNTNIHWEAVEADARFQQLHRDKNKFLWRMMLFALISYFLLPISTAYLQNIFKVKVLGVINVGLVFALLQFVVAWVIAMIYAKRANSEFDARAQALVKDAHNIKGVI